VPNRKSRRGLRSWIALLLAATLAPLMRPNLVWATKDAPATDAAKGLSFRVVLDKHAAGQPISGRLFVFLSAREKPEPMRGPQWFGTEPFFGIDVRDFKPGGARIVDDSADAHPGKPSQLPPGEYYAQALLDHDFDHSLPAGGAGNLFSRVEKVTIPEPAADDVATKQVVELTLTESIPARELKGSKWVKPIARHSELLSKFHGREVTDYAAVALPPSYYAQPKRRFPVVYVISGFGGTVASLSRRYLKAPRQPGEGEAEFIRVLLSGQCKWGHHVYANSATNGPRGDALVEELVPYVDKHFRTVAEPTARYLTGHSSGGWSSLWLQVGYPDEFGGVWSTSPDPVDFRDWQQIDLYADPPLSLYVDPVGKPRPIARRGGKAFAQYETFCRLDDCLKRGGQIRSFEAVFSPRGDDGEPLKMFDRQTGRVNPRVVEAWKRYDIRLLLRDRWQELGPKLAGKVHIWTGGEDTFYLEGAVRRLKGQLARLGSDAQIEIVPGRDHSSLLTGKLSSTIARQMSETFWSHHGRPEADRPASNEGQR